jgi:hypothetical protein
MAWTPQQHAEWLQTMVATARQQPDGRLDITDQTGAVIATVQAHDLPRRPKDMPRALRPKRKLSKRQRAAARRSKLTAA